MGKRILGIEIIIHNKTKRLAGNSDSDTKYKHINTCDCDINQFL